MKSLKTMLLGTVSLLTVFSFSGFGKENKITNDSIYETSTKDNDLNSLSQAQFIYFNSTQISDSSINLEWQFQTYMTDVKSVAIYDESNLVEDITVGGSIENQTPIYTEELPAQDLSHLNTIEGSYLVEGLKPNQEYSYVIVLFYQLLPEQNYQTKEDSLLVADLSLTRSATVQENVSNNVIWVIVLSIIVLILLVLTIVAIFSEIIYKREKKSEEKN